MLAALEVLLQARHKTYCRLDLLTFWCRGMYHISCMHVALASNFGICD